MIQLIVKHGIYYCFEKKSKTVAKFSFSSGVDNTEVYDWYLSGEDLIVKFADLSVI